MSVPDPAGTTPLDVAALGASLRQQQRPVKARYRDDPASAVIPAEASATVDQRSLTATVPTWAGDLVAGLHPGAGGDGSRACSADLVLQALVACAGVTLAAVATALGLELRRAQVRASTTWDARGTLGLDREARVGLGDVELVLDLEVLTADGRPAAPEQVDKLVQLTERYCVVARTLTEPAGLSVRLA
ncbi:OsmC family protein [Ornithinimicrobium flavum]|uniref:OsmC family protein n=1 Tax=Ornithinimicrobium flavum TaxID=1288636 RepID=UPI001EE7FFD7|nr:OsmC family protein [Ornithinimicrobium flavum]